MMSQKHLGRETFDRNKDIYHVYMQSIQKLNQFIFSFLYFTLVFTALFIDNKEAKDKINFAVESIAWNCTNWWN